MAELTSAVDRIATTLDDPDVVALDVPSDPALEETAGGEVVRPPVALARAVGDVYREDPPVGVATPEALRQVGVDQGRWAPMSRSSPGRRVRVLRPGRPPLGLHRIQDPS